MYIVVQRVISPVTRQTGVNAFLYLHPGRSWETPPADIPGTDPGRLVQKALAVVPHDNRVRSNLDVVAPDDIAIPQIRAHLFALMERKQFSPFPWEGADGPCWFRIHMVSQLVTAGWAREAKALAAAGARLIEHHRFPELRIRPR